MNSNMKRFNLDNYILFVWYDKERHYPFRTNLYDSKNEVEVHYGEYITVQQLCYMTHKEILIYQDCNDAVQLLLDIEKMNDVLDVWLEGLGD